MNTSRSVEIVAVAFGLWCLRSLPQHILQAPNGGTIAVVFCCWLSLLAMTWCLQDRTAATPNAKLTIRQEPGQGYWIYAGVGIAILGALADVTVVRQIGACWILASAIASPAARGIWLVAAVAWLPGAERFWAQLGYQSVFFRLLPILGAGGAIAYAVRPVGLQRRVS
jgi:hypothetical protein